MSATAFFSLLKWIVGAIIGFFFPIKITLVTIVLTVTMNWILSKSKKVTNAPEDKKQLPAAGIRAFIYIMVIIVIHLWTSSESSRLASGWTWLALTFMLVMESDEFIRNWKRISNYPITDKFQAFVNSIKKIWKR